MNEWGAEAAAATSPYMVIRRAANPAPSHYSVPIGCSSMLSMHSGAFFLLGRTADPTRNGGCTRFPEGGVSTKPGPSVLGRDHRLPPATGPTAQRSASRKRGLH